MHYYFLISQGEKCLLYSAAQIYLTYRGFRRLPTLSASATNEVKYLNPRMHYYFLISRGEKCLVYLAAQLRSTWLTADFDDFNFVSVYNKWIAEELIAVSSYICLEWLISLPGFIPPLTHPHIIICSSFTSSKDCTVFIIVILQCHLNEH